MTFVAKPAMVQQVLSRNDSTAAILISWTAYAAVPAANLLGRVITRHAAVRYLEVLQCAKAARAFINKLNITCTWNSIKGDDNG